VIRPQSICLLRLSAIGDVTHALAVIHQLRRKLPDCELTWVIGKLEHKLLSGLPDVELVVFDKSAGWSGYQALRRQLGGRRFDVLLHMQVAGRANLASLCVGAGIRIGYDSDRSKDLHGLFINQRIAKNPNQHVLDCLLSFLEPLGLTPDPPDWQLPLTEADHEFAHQHIDGNRPTLIISPCSSHPLRNWPAVRHAAVADHALGMGFQVILAGGPSEFERGFGKQIESAMTGKADNLIGRDTLKQGAAMLAAADLVVAPDTGPAHMANAMGTPVIGLYAASNPRRSGPYNFLECCVDRYDQAARQFLGKSSEQIRWGRKVEVAGAMELITVDDVIKKLEQYAG
jgi:heptosyltransferase I